MGVDELDGLDFDPFLDADDDRALFEVAEKLYALDPDGSRWARVVRRTYDMIYNGQETGRYRWDQLMKTEKTHFGTLFEINAQREFGFEGRDEDKTDFRIAGHLVDAKWSQRVGEWMLPPEVFGELALVATGDDAGSWWSVGLVRVRDEYRRERGNRDSKTQLNPAGRRAVKWLWPEHPLRPNVLLQLPRPTVDNIFDHWAGTQRTHRLFRAAEGLVVHRNAVATVSRQLDHQKRVRYNGGSRSALRPEGYIILSGSWRRHREIAADLGVPIPLSDEYISVRVVPSRGPGAVLERTFWRRAHRDEVSLAPAPLVPEPKSEDES